MKRNYMALSLLLALAVQPLTAAAEALPPGTDGSPLTTQQMQIMPADLDGSGAPDVLDLIRMQKFLHGTETLSDAAFLAADVNHDGETDVFDLALSKSALVNGTVYDTWGVRYDVQNAQWDGTYDGKDAVLDSEEDLLAWLENAEWLHLCDMTIYPEQYDAAFFAEHQLAVIALPCIGSVPCYRVRGIEDEGGTLWLKLAADRRDIGEDGDWSNTMQLTFVELPRSLTEDRTVRWELLTHDVIGGGCDYPDLYDFSQFNYTSPDGSYTLRVEQTAYLYSQDSTDIEFAWVEEDGFIKLDTLTAGFLSPFSDDETSGDFSIAWGETAVTVTFKDSETTEKTVTFDYPDRTMTRQTADFSIASKGAPEITSVTVTADCWGTLSRKCRIRDEFRKDVMATGLVGRVGAPFEYTTSGTVENAELTVHYDESELRGIPETNLIVLCDKGSSYPTVACTQDTEANTLTFTPEQEGTYIIADAYTWYGRWGQDVSQYAYTVDKTAYPSNWERECGTGSIMELADKAWAVANAPDFHVTTPQELASATYYINAVADNEPCSIILENDIDLAGFDWTPLGWDGQEFGSVRTRTECCGTIDGQGHTIRNLHVTGNGFVGVSTDLRVQNITFENASVDGGTNVGIVCGETYSSVELVNVHASGNIQASSVAKVGSLCGNGIGASFTDCTADVTVNGEPCAYFSDFLRAQAETVVEHPILLTVNADNTITREESEYDNLSWVIYSGGEHVLTRNAENGTTLDLSTIKVTPPGATYVIYVTAYVGGHYVPISNSVEVTY